MATELVKRTVDGEEYEFEQFGAKQSLRVLLKLSKILGKPMMISMGSMKKGEDGKSKKMDEKVLGEAAQALFGAMDEEETLTLIETLTSEKVLCNGKKIKFDSHFEAKLGHLFNVLIAALDVQYGNFLEGLIDNLDLKSEAVLTPAKLT